MPAGGERDDLDGEVGSFGGLDQVLDLRVHDLVAADGAAQHGLVQYDPVLRWVRPGEELLAGETESHCSFGKILGGGGEAGCGDGPDVAFGLQ